MEIPLALEVDALHAAESGESTNLALPMHAYPMSAAETLVRGGSEAWTDWFARSYFLENNSTDTTQKLLIETLSTVNNRGAWTAWVREIQGEMADLESVLKHMPSTTTGGSVGSFSDTKRSEKMRKRAEYWMMSDAERADFDKAFKTSSRQVTLAVAESRVGVDVSFKISEYIEHLLRVFKRRPPIVHVLDMMDLLKTRNAVERPQERVDRMIRLFDFHVLGGKASFVDDYDNHGFVRQYPSPEDLPPDPEGASELLCRLFKEAYPIHQVPGDFEELRTYLFGDNTLTVEETLKVMKKKPLRMLPGLESRRAQLIDALLRSDDSRPVGTVTPFDSIKDNLENRRTKQGGKQVFESFLKRLHKALNARGDIERQIRMLEEVMKLRDMDTPFSEKRKWWWFGLDEPKLVMDDEVRTTCNNHECLDGIQTIFDAYNETLDNTTRVP